MIDRLRLLLDDILGEETPKEDDQEEAKIKWIIDEFDFRNNNEDLIPGIDLVMTKSRSKKSRKRSSFSTYQTPQSNSYSSSFDSDSYYSSDESSDVAQFQQFHKNKDKARKKLRTYYCLCFFCLNIIFSFEYFFRDVLWSYSVRSLIPEIQEHASQHQFWRGIYYCGNGRELNMLFLYHMIFSGKYHRAFMTSIHVASFFMISNCLQLLYQDPRPFWMDNEIQAFSCSKGFGNPCGHMMSAAVFASLVICER